MADLDQKVVLCRVGPVEVLEMALAEAAKIGALEALAGRKATELQLREVTRRFLAEIHACAELCARDPEVSDADLAQAARTSGQAAVVAVLGPLQPVEAN